MAINKTALYAFGFAALIFGGTVTYLNNATMSPEKLDAMMERQAEYQEKYGKKENTGTSSVALITDCQLRLKATLRNPSSLKMQISSSQAQKTSEGTRVSLPYSAENGFGGMTSGHAVCVYDSQGKLTSSQFN